MQSGKVSVIIPVYNGEAYVGQAIDSALAQTYTDSEVIVVDDGSKDSTRQIIESYGHKVRAVHKPNGGTSSALNAGIRLAQGEFIAWLSHDDLFLPRKSEAQVNYLRTNPALAACYSDFFIIDGEGRHLSEVKAGMGCTKTEKVRQLFASTNINGCTMLIRAEVFQKLGLFREDLKYRSEEHTSELQSLRHLVC